MRSLLERFKPKVTIIEENKDIDYMEIDGLVGSIKTYEITLPSSQKPKDSTLKASDNQEKYTEMPYNITRNELAHMAKKIKKVMKFNQKF